MRYRFRIWNRDVFGNIEMKKRCAEEIQNWDRKEENEGLTEDNCRLQNELKLEYERILAMEEVMWRQKSRVQWLKEWDNNTRFFSIR